LLLHLSHEKTPGEKNLSDARGVFKEFKNLINFLDSGTIKAKSKPEEEKLGRNFVRV